jgi:hypothetical protein
VPELVRGLENFAAAAASDYVHLPSSVCKPALVIYLLINRLYDQFSVLTVIYYHCFAVIAL